MLPLPNRLLLLTAVALGVAVPTRAEAQEPDRPPGLERFTNPSPDFVVRLRLDQLGLLYDEGADLAVAVATTRGGFLYVFHEDAGGAVVCLFPNAVDRQNAIPATPPGAREPVWATPLGPGAKTSYKVRPPGGRAAVKAVVTTERLESVEKGVAALAANPQGPKILALTADLQVRVWADLTGAKPAARAALADPLGLRAQLNNLPRTQQWAEHGVGIAVAAKGAGPAGPHAQVVPFGSRKPVVPPAARDRPRRVGVFIGVSDYQSEQLPLLRVCHKDARDLADLMKAACHLDNELVVVNREATKARIEEVFAREVWDATRPGDEVFVYWSGHGGQMPEPNRAVRRPFRLYLVPYDGRPDDLDSIRNTMVLDTTFGQWIRTLALADRRVIVVLDTCHSGAVAARDEGVKAVPLPPAARAVPNVPNQFMGDVLDGARILGLRDVWVLTSSRADQRSFERKEKDHGVMTFFLLERLGQKGPVTLKDAAEYVRAKVPAYVKQTWVGNQEPQFNGPDNPILVIRRQ